MLKRNAAHDQFKERSLVQDDVFDATSAGGAPLERNRSRTEAGAGLVR